MENREILNLEEFRFRGLHPGVFMGTASDRYAGWLGKIYSPERYGGRITSRTKRLGRKSFREDVLPLESVEEYFEHFSILELDFTFYGLLLDGRMTATPTLHTLRNYRRHLGREDRLILKVPQAVFSRQRRKGGRFETNPLYLDAEVFARRFYDPAVDLLGDAIYGFVFEQEYQRKKDRMPERDYLKGIAEFLGRIPKDDRYHIEIRTEGYLKPAYFRILENHGVGQVLSHWTWLPPLARQFEKGGRQFFNASDRCIVRLMTPPGIRYEDAYERAHPFDREVEGMVDPGMIRDTVKIMREALDRGVEAGVISNNRAGGSAPLIARKVAEGFLQSMKDG